MKPIDIEMKQFKKARFGGFDTDDVNEFLDEVVRNYENVHRENFTLKAEILELNKQLDYYREMETTLQNTMIRAEKVSEETTDRANEEAEQILLEGTFKSDQMIEEARQEVYAVTENLISLKKQYETAKAQMKKLLQSQLESLDSDVMAVEEFSSIPEEDLDYTKEYQIIDEEDVI